MRISILPVLDRLYCCSDSRAWIEAREEEGVSITQMWDTCPDPTWIIWLAKKTRAVLEATLIAAILAGMKACYLPLLTDTERESVAPYVRLLTIYCEKPRLFTGGTAAALQHKEDLAAAKKGCRLQIESAYSSLNKTLRCSYLIGAHMRYLSDPILYEDGDVASPMEELGEIADMTEEGKEAFLARYTDTVRSVIPFDAVHKALLKRQKDMCK